MHQTHRPFFLSAAALGVAALVAACGGGEAEPPPDTTAPTLAITDDVGGATASGAVTFTFTFSEDVGSSFVAEDVLVTGGTAGTLTKVSATVYTLVVTPPADSTGTLAVSVAAAKFRDLSNNDNTAESTASQAFSTVVAPPPSGTVLANFDSVLPPVAGFEGAEGSAVEAPPAGGGTTGNAFKVLRSGGQVYALGIIETTVPLAADRRTVSARVYSPTAGIPMVLKLEGPNGANTGDTQANETVVQGWQTLTWTFAGADVTKTYNKIVLLPNLGTVDAPPGKAYFFDDFLLLAAAGGGGGSSGTLTFSTGFSSSTRTIQGGEVGGFSGSNLDGYNCGAPASCGGGGEFAPALAAADSYFFYYYQTPTPAADLYMGIYVQAPGVTGGFSPTADTAGVQVGSQTQLKFKLGQNPEWFGSGTNNFMIVMDLGKRYTAGGGTCRLQLRRVVTPTAAAATSYSIPLNSFALVQDCAGAAANVAAALAASPISQISFQGVGGGIALSDGTRTSGANLSVPANGVYPTTVVLVGGITIE